MNNSKKNVLIVEDDNLLLMVTSKLVKKIGHDVVATANNGRTALEHIATHDPDIVLMDIRLKGDWDGIETVKHIKNQYTIPVIYLSGSSYPQSRDRAMQIGFEGFLEKPVQIEQLKHAFQKAFNKESKPPLNRHKVS